MKALIIVGSSLAYAAVWFGLSVLYMRFVATHLRRCHAESKSGSAYTWHDPDACARWCRPGCWRVEGLTVRSAAIGSALALLWPLTSIPVVSYVLANRVAGPTPDDAVIARLERELGMDTR